MITWLAKYRISASLDQPGRHAPNSGSPAPGQCPGQAPEPVRAFADEIASVDALLRQHSGTGSFRPVYFHGSIMRAVRAAAPPVPPARSIRWAPALGLCAVGLAGLFWMISQRGAPLATPGPLESASNVLALGNEFPEDASATIAKPMSDEWEHLNRDIERTTRFLLSSVP